MIHPPPRSRLLAAAGLLLLLPLGVLAGAALAPTKPAVIAVVDLEKVYGALDEQAAADATLESLAAKAQSELDTRRNEIEGLRVELDSYNAGTPAFKELSARIDEKLVAYTAKVDFNRQRIEARRAELIRRIYDRVKTTLAVLAKESGWDVVFLDDSIPALEPSDATRTMQQISARRMLYCDRALDVTTILVQRMNEDYKRGGGAGSGAGTGSGAAPAGTP